MSQPITQSLNYDDWSSGLQLNAGSAVPKRNLTNVFHALSHAIEWKDEIWFDDFRQKITRRNASAWSGNASRLNVSWSDNDSIEVMLWCQAQGIDVSKTTVEEGISHAARQNHSNPLVQYLDTLEWDQTPRIDFWLKDHMGAEDTPLSRAMGRCWLISAVARIYEPGCQADHCLILEGRQGLKKSTALRTLAGSEWFAEHNADSLVAKDAAINCNGVWILEFSELGNVRTNNKEEVKAFVTRRFDHYRPPYERHAITIPRTCVFAGTTNETAYLIDDTGNRRYWPIKCAFADIDGLAEKREQLWAEAVFEYRRGQPWHLSPELERAAGIEQDKRMEVSPWAESLNEYIEGMAASRQKTISILSFLRTHLNMETSKISNREVKQVASCLKTIGWKAERTAKGTVWHSPQRQKTRARANV